MPYSQEDELANLHSLLAIMSGITKTRCETIVFELFEQISRETRPSIKIELLKNAYESCPQVFKAIVKIVYDDDLVLGVGSQLVNSVKHGEQYKTNFQEFLELVRQLQKTSSTKKKKQLLEQFFSRTDSFHAKWYKRILLKDLRIGVDLALIQQVLKEEELHKLLGHQLIKFKPMLATSYDSLSSNQIDKLFHQGKHVWHFEPKIDGFRLLVHIQPDGSFICLSRNLKEVKPAEELLAEDISKLYQKHKQLIQKYESGIILDGELFSKNWNITMALGPNAKNIPAQAIQSMKLYLFDLIKDPQKFNRHEYPVPYIKRKQELKQLLEHLKFKHLVYLPEKLVPEKYRTASDKYLSEVAQALIRKGFEGAVAKIKDSPYYSGKRTKYWIKFKQFKTLDLMCVRVIPSDKNPDELGAIVVLYKGKEVKVGSGFTKEQRRYYLQHPEAIVGKIVEVKFMEETKDGSLRHPIFVRVRYDKDKPDA